MEWWIDDVIHLVDWIISCVLGHSLTKAYKRVVRGHDSQHYIIKESVVFEHETRLCCVITLVPFLFIWVEVFIVCIFNKVLFYSPKNNNIGSGRERRGLNLIKNASFFWGGQTWLFWSLFEKWTDSKSFFSKTIFPMNIGF